MSARGLIETTIRYVTEVSAARQTAAVAAHRRPKGAGVLLPGLMLVSTNKTLRELTLADRLNEIITRQCCCKTVVHGSTRRRFRSAEDVADFKH
jgi:hypothetical protein